MQPLIASTLLLFATTALSTSPQEPLQPHFSPPSLESSRTEALLNLHKDLVTHPSITGDEDSVGRYLTNYLRSKNFTVEQQEVALDPPRANIFAYSGQTRKTRTLISSHIDTVPPFLKYERRGDEIWGRGSVDAKGSVASQIIAVEDLLASGTIGEGDVGLLYVVGEETGGKGMRKANDLGLTWDTVIFGEPTELKLASGHKGIMSLQISAKGKAGHSGYPELGKSANAMLIPALHALMTMELPSSEKYGNTTLNIGRMEGGVAGNVIAEEASAIIALRIADGSPEVIKKAILDTIKGLGEELDVEFIGGYGPVYIDSDAPGKQIPFIFNLDLLADVAVLPRFRDDCGELWDRHPELERGP